MTNQEFIESISLEGEVWKIIPEWERYMVSNFGRIVALAVPYMQAGIPRCRKPQLIKPRLNNSKPSYYGVVLSDGNGYRKHQAVHRLVASVFIPNPNNYTIVNHKDENTHNNCADNLEWCTQQYNCNWGTHNERMAKTISETAYQRRKVIWLSLNNEYLGKFNSIKEAAEAAGVSHSAVSQCCRQKRDSLCGFKWMYQENYHTFA